VIWKSTINPIIHSFIHTEIAKSKYPWFNSLYKLLLEADCSNFLTNLSHDFFKNNFKKVCTNFKYKLINDDIKMMCENPSLIALRRLKTHVGTSKFYCMNLPWNVIVLLQNLRLNSPRIPTKTPIYLNCVNKYWKNGLTQNCELCNYNHLEDSFHVMFQCPHYKAPRSRFLSDYMVLNPTKDEFIYVIFSNVTKINFLNIYHFWINAMRIRKLYLDEML